MRADRQLTVRDPELALQLYRIAGEALANAAKHSGCAGVTVDLTNDGSELVLSVSDDGRGVPEGDEPGLGQRIMTYRAGLAGGTLRVSSVPGKGTILTCRIPRGEGRMG